MEGQEALRVNYSVTKFRGYFSLLLSVLAAFETVDQFFLEKILFVPWLLCAAV